MQGESFADTKKRLEKRTRALSPPTEACTNILTVCAVKPWEDLPGGAPAGESPAAQVATHASGVGSGTWPAAVTKAVDPTVTSEMRASRS